MGDEDNYRQLQPRRSAAVAGEQDVPHHTQHPQLPDVVLLSALSSRAAEFFMFIIYIQAKCFPQS